jgi:peptide/nickel transport system permease protein
VIRYIMRRLGLIVVTMIVASLIIFAITQLLPGDVAQMILGRWATKPALANLRAQLGLDRPWFIQYGDWLIHFVTGDWGKSLQTGSPIQPLVLMRLRNSMYLAALALLLYVPFGILLGVIAALRRDRWQDQLISSFTMAFVGLPEFVTGLLLIALLAFQLKLFPANSSIDPEVGFLKALPQLILPAMTVSLVSLGYVARMTRSSTIEALKTDYARAAYLKGLPPATVLFKHVLRNSLLPTVTVVAMGIGWVIAGLIVTESVFGYPGLGRLVVYSIQRRDLPLIQASTMIVIAIYGVSNLVADILYAVLNPRIRFR